MKQRFDIIGDIHGHADTLRALLDQLGYRKHDGVFQHPTRQAIFVGDFIDRGPKIRETLQLVRGMVDSGHALAVLGNHEVNALRMYHHGPNGEPLRAHSAKNLRQHQATLDQLALPSPDEWEEYLRWFRSLPLFLDLGNLRVVHAAWCSKAVATLGHRRFSDDDFLVSTSLRGTPENDAIRILINGPEIDLPEGLEFFDREGHPHHNFRARWFGPGRNGSAKFRDMIFPAPFGDCLPDAEIPAACLADLPHHTEDEPLVAFGHYWHPPVAPEPPAHNAVCVDYSVAQKGGGLLVAYRWDGERQANPGKFVWVETEPIEK